MLSISEWLNSFFLKLNTLIFNSDELILIFLIYNFMKLIVFNSIIELIWPTHFFNKKNNINFSIIKYRGFIESFLKLRKNYKQNYIFYKAFYNYYLVNVKNIKKKRI